MHTGWVGRGARRPHRSRRARGVDDRARRRADDRACRGTTLMPGLIEGHSHLLLHPYNETSWNDQVLREALALRVARGVNHARATLMAGITTVRDLGSEGAAYADVGLRAGDQRRHRSRPAHAGGRSGDGGHRQLRAERICARGDRAARRRRSRRPRRRGARGARSDRARRGLHQDLRRLSLGPERRSAAGLHARRDPAHRRGRQQQRPSRWSRTRHRRKACGARSWAASRPSSTATRARRRSGS